jgi:hypothetical protein
VAEYMSQEEILARNPQVKPEELEKARELRRQLREMGVQRKGYDLAPPFGGKHAVTRKDEWSADRIIHLNPPGKAR